MSDEQVKGIPEDLLAMIITAIKEVNLHSPDTWLHCNRRGCAHLGDEASMQIGIAVFDAISARSEQALAVLEAQMKERQQQVEHYDEALSLLQRQLAALEARNRELYAVIRGFNDLFVSEPRMYLHPCAPNYRMTYADSERVDAAFMKIDAALKKTS